MRARSYDAPRPRVVVLLLILTPRVARRVPSPHPSCAAAQLGLPPRTPTSPLVSPAYVAILENVRGEHPPLPVAAWRVGRAWRVAA